MESNKMSKIPSDEEFARVSREMAHEARNLDMVRQNVLCHFENLCPLVNFHLLPQRDVNFRAYVFFKANRDIEHCTANGIVKEIQDFVYVELARSGRGEKKDIKVAFEFDSDENVIANFEGDYYLRLR